MKYIDEINAFYDWLETNSISDSAIDLWHALMHINSKAGWVPEFAVAISTLETKTGLKKDAIIRARLRLQQAGRIDFRSRSGQQSAIYKIISFFDCVALSDTNSDTNRNANRALTATQTATQTASISSNNIPIVVKGDAPFVDNVEKPYKELIKHFSNNIHLMTPVEYEKLIYWIEDQGMQEDAVMFAIEEAATNDRKNVAYIEGILRDWHGKGIKRRMEAEQAKQKFKERRRQTSNRQPSAGKDTKASFDNFTKRQYDPKSLEEALLKKSKGELAEG
ncbi:MAG TPA: DnaD domain protein [Candidatus Nitrosocosmicus sp.]|nr:DnaD domain protein [Candidatus Nitrosocosmicus sp.]